jgi:DNA repair protein RadC
MEPTNLPISQWAEDDKPREKLMLKGKIVLSDAELIAILIGSGSKNESAVELSKRILAASGFNLNSLGKCSLDHLMQFKGIGEAKAITIVAAMELGRRRRAEEVKTLTKVNSSKVVFEVMQPLIGELAHEEFWVLCLNNANKIIHKFQLSKGGMTATVVDMRLVFKSLFEQNATALILVHNHPSGSLKPSEADIQITQKIKAAAKQLDFSLLDHLIVTEHAYFSFADEGIL